MSNKPDFTQMTSSELRVYVLDHREDQEALQTFVDKRRAENPNPRVYQPGDDFKTAIAEHLESLRQKNQVEGDR
jgi:hypothetical protein